MMHRIMAYALAGFVALTATLRAQETSYDSKPRTAEPATPELDRLVNLESNETGYNAKGTLTNSKIGLLSTRRDDPEYPAFLLGLQSACIDAYGRAMNVAPVEAKSLAEQAKVLQRRGVETFLVDSPDPQEAADFFGHGKFLQREATLIAAQFPKGMNPPIVLSSPLLYSERVGEEAIRFVGNIDVEVAYIMDEGDTSIEDFRGKIMMMFEKPFKNVAPNIRLTEIDPETYQPGLVPPSVVCVLTPELSAKWSLKLREKFPDSKIICVGEHPETVKAFKEKLIDIRLRPDYQRILGNAIQESKQRSPMGIVLHPQMDKHWDAPKQETESQKTQ